MANRKLEAVKRIGDNAAYTFQDLFKYVLIGAAFGFGFHVVEWFVTLFLGAWG